MIAARGGILMAAPVVRFRIDFAHGAYVGPGKIALLEAIRASGSLSQAARDLGMSYRRAWQLVDSLKEAFREPVTTASTGGKGGGGVSLTAFGASLIMSYRELDQDIAALAAKRLRRIVPVVSQPAPSSTRSKRRALAHRL
jgi:molybdate transport system regulatory protein